jgi:hypothetical protein
VIGGLLGRTSLGLFFQIIFNKTQFQSVKSPFAQFRCRRTANCSAAIWMGKRIASPGNVPGTSSVAAPSVLPLPH